MNSNQIESYHAQQRQAEADEQVRREAKRVAKHVANERAAQELQERLREAAAAEQKRREEEAKIQREREEAERLEAAAKAAELDRLRVCWRKGCAGNGRRPNGNDANWKSSCGGSGRWQKKHGRWRRHVWRSCGDRSVFESGHGK